MPTTWMDDIALIRNDPKELHELLNITTTTNLGEMLNYKGNAEYHIIQLERKTEAAYLTILIVLGNQYFNNTLLAKKLCDSNFLSKNLDLIYSHFNMYGFRSYLLLYIIKWYVGWCGVCFGVNH